LSFNIGVGIGELLEKCIIHFCNNYNTPTLTLILNDIYEGGGEGVIREMYNMRVKVGELLEKCIIHFSNNSPIYEGESGDRGVIRKMYYTFSYAPSTLTLILTTLPNF
jgi:hypothetical protein